MKIGLCGNIRASISYLYTEIRAHESKDKLRGVNTPLNLQMQRSGEPSERDCNGWDGSC